MGDLLGSNKNRFATELEELNANLIIIIIIINIKKKICNGIFVFKLFFGIYFNYFATEFASIRDRFFVANLRRKINLSLKESATMIFATEICDGKSVSESLLRQNFHFQRQIFLSLKPIFLVVIVVLQSVRKI